MSEQIKIIDYRNGRYQGYLQDEKYQGFGMLFTDDFTLCIANWRNNELYGPCFMVFPDDKLFYGGFLDGRMNGCCCYDMGEECQIYSFFEGEDTGGVAAVVFPMIDCVAEVRLKNRNVFSDESDDIETIIQNRYFSQREKWEHVERILNGHILDEVKEYRKFLLKHFLEPYDYLLEEIRGKQYYFGCKEEGCGFYLTNKKRLRSIGWFTDDNLLSIGKRNYSDGKIIKTEQIIPDASQSFSYVHGQRSKKLRKILRDYYRKSLNFQNQFIETNMLNTIQNHFRELKVNLKNHSTEKIAQQLLENPKEYSGGLTPPKKRRDRDEISIEKVKEQIYRSANKKQNETFEYRSSNHSPSQVNMKPNISLRSSNQKQNPEISYERESSQEKFPSRIYANINVDKSHEKYEYQPGRIQHQTPPKPKERKYEKEKPHPSKLEKLSQMYDDLPLEEASHKKPATHPRKYYYNDINQLYKNDLGFSTGKKHETVQARKSRSPYAPDRQKYNYFPRD